MKSSEMKSNDESWGGIGDKNMFKTCAEERKTGAAAQNLGAWHPASQLTDWAITMTAREALNGRFSIFGVSWSGAGVVERPRERESNGKQHTTTNIFW